MSPVLAGVARTVTKSFDNEYTCIADVTRTFTINGDPKTRHKQ